MVATGRPRCDPYCGSGRAAAVALQLDRRFVGAEILEKYHALAEETAATPPPLPTALQLQPQPQPQPTARPILTMVNGVAPVIASAMQRTKKDPIAVLLAKATACGVRFRISGATLKIAGADALHRDDQACLRRYAEDIRLRLEPPAPTVDLLDQLDVEVEVITDAARAREALAALLAPAFGFDLETAPLSGNGSAMPWNGITKDGRRAVHQPAPESRDGLDPLRAMPRTAQIFDPTTATVLIIDFQHVPISVLKALEHKKLVIHNSAFEHAMLLAQGIRLRRTWCTLQMARLVYGAERGGLRLADIAAELLDLELPKDEQVSDWRAERLSESQLGYAAADAVIAQRIADKLWVELDEMPAAHSSSATRPCRRSLPCGSPVSLSTAQCTSRRSPPGKQPTSRRTTSSSP